MEYAHPVSQRIIVPVDRLMESCDPPDDPEWPTPWIGMDVHNLLKRLPFWAQIACGLVAVEMALPYWHRYSHLLPPWRPPIDPYSYAQITNRDTEDIDEIEWPPPKNYATDIYRAPEIAVEAIRNYVAFGKQKGWKPKIVEAYNLNQSASDFAWGSYLATVEPDEGINWSPWWSLMGSIDAIEYENGNIYRTLSSIADSAHILCRIILNEISEEINTVISTAWYGYEGNHPYPSHFSIGSSAYFARWWQLCRCRLAFLIGTEDR